MARLYSNLKFLRYTDRHEAIAERRTVAPVHVRIKPINHCNHNCWYCAYRADQLQLGEGMEVRDRMPEAKIMEVADDLIEMGVEAVTFSGGGEPLIYKPLPVVVEKLAAGGIAIAALTNGSNLQGRVADAFAEHGTWIRVSIDAWDDESYAESRSVKPGEFSRVIENLRVFAACRSDCTLGVSFIVNADNASHGHDVCMLMKDVGVDHVKLSAAVVSNDVHENNLYHRAIMEEVTSQIDRASALSDESYSVVNHYHETDERFEKDYGECPFLQFLTIIGADCNVYTCQDKAYNDSGLLGSIRERSFKDFWFSDENATRMSNVDPRRDCRHHCIAHNKNRAIIEYLDVDRRHARFV